MPDDVVPDRYGNVLVIDLNLSIHALIRLNLTTGQHETVASQGFIEPQGIVLDGQGHIYVSDDYANILKSLCLRLHNEEIRVALFLQGVNPGILRVSIL